MPQRPQQNLDAMRQDAIRRSREMQRRAVPPPQTDYRPPEPPPEPIPPKLPPIPEHEPPPPPPQKLKLPDELNGLLTDWNGEKMALAGLLYLLYKEGADVSLLLALAYVLL